MVFLAHRIWEHGSTTGRPGWRAYVDSDEDDKKIEYSNFNLAKLDSHFKQFDQRFYQNNKEIIDSLEQQFVK